MSREYEPRLSLYQPPVAPNPSDRYIASDAFAEQITPEILDMYAEFGLDSIFLPILGRHIRDTHVIVGGSSAFDSTLTTAIPQNDAPRNDTKVWQRQLLIPNFTVDCYAKNITNGLKIFGKKFPGSIPTDSPFINQDGTLGSDVTRMLAIKMLFAESSIDMLGNSVYMQQRFEKYIPDFNGQSPHYTCELEVPRQFYDQYAYDEPGEHELRADLLALRHGIGLNFLKVDLLRFELVSKMKYAEWLIRSVQQKKPGKAVSGVSVSPHDEYAISQRVMSLEPRFGAARAMIELAHSFDSE